MVERSSAMNRLVDRYHRAADAVDRFLFAIAGLLFVLAVVSTALGFLGRQFPSVLPDVSWSAELTVIPIVTAVLLVAPHGLRKDTQLAVTWLPDRVPDRGFRVLTVINQLLIASFLFVVAAYGIGVVQNNLPQATPVLKLSWGWVYASIVLSALMMLLATVVRLIEALLGRAPRPLDALAASDA